MDEATAVFTTALMLLSLFLALFFVSSLTLSVRILIVQGYWYEKTLILISWALFFLLLEPEFRPEIEYIFPIVSLATTVIIIINLFKQKARLFWKFTGFYIVFSILTYIVIF